MGFILFFGVVLLLSPFFVTHIFALWAQIIIVAKRHGR